MGRPRTDLEQLTATWARIAEGQIVEDTVSYRAAVRILTERLARIVRPGQALQPYVHAMLAQGYRRATAYQVVRAAFAIAAERVVKTGSVPAAAPAVCSGSASPTTPRRTPPPPTAPVPVRPPNATRPVVEPSRVAPPGTKAPLEHYPADALPAHLQPGMTFALVENGGRVWIDNLPFETHRDAPFGVDAQGSPWAPYGQDAKGRFLNYFGATLGTSGRIGQGHFVGEPDEP
jgi:hypothetical protein